MPTEYDPFKSFSTTAAPDMAQETQYAGYLDRMYSNNAVSAVNYADGPSSGIVPNIGPTFGLMQLDPDPFGSTTDKLAKANPGSGVTGDRSLGLDIFGKRMSREQLEASDAGRELLEIADARKQGRRRGFMEALLGDLSWGDLPFVSLFAQVGSSFADAALVSRTFEKLQNGEPVTDEELIKTKLYQERAKYEQDGSWGAMLGDIVRAAPGFMVEFLATGGTYSLARAGLSKAIGGGIHLGMTRASKLLAREATERFAQREISSAAVKGAASLADDAVRSSVVSKVSKQVVNSTMRNNQMYRGLGDDTIEALARERAEYEYGKMLARSQGGALAQHANKFTQWLGQNVSRGLMDYGRWGTEASSVLYTSSSKASRAMADAIGTFFVEAPLKGLAMYGGNLAVSKGISAATGTEFVSDTELSLKNAAYLTNNRELMKSAEGISMFTGLLEYVSENTGRGFNSLFRAAGMGLEKLGAKGLVRPATLRLTEVGGIAPDADGVAVGGKIRQWVDSVLGTPEDYGRKVSADRARIVTRKLGLAAADEPAIARAIDTGSTESLPREIADRIGPDIGKFTKDAVREDLSYGAYVKYATADFMARHQVGPEFMMNFFESMGYDGVLGEILEERYNDVAKGLFGLNEYNDKTFKDRVVRAVQGMWPGWDQLLAEAVGFSIPLATRAGIMRLQSAIGGASEFKDIRAHLSGMDDVMRHDQVLPMKHGDYLAMQERLAAQDDVNVAQINDAIAAARERADSDAVDALTRDLETAEVSRQRRAERHQRFYSTIPDAAKDNYDAMLYVPLYGNDVIGDETRNDLTPTATSEQAEQAVKGSSELVDYSPVLARRLWEGQAPMEGEDLKWYRRAAHRIVGIAGAVVTGDLGLAAANPTEWIARDMGMCRSVVTALKTGFGQEVSDAAGALADQRREVHTKSAKFDVERERLLREKTDASGESLDAAGLEAALAQNETSAQQFRTENAKVLQDGPSYNPTRAEVLQEAEHRFAPKARAIMSANLALHQLRHFSDGKILDQAIAHHASRNGYTVSTDGDRVSLFRTAPDGGVDESTVTTADEYYRANKGDIDAVKTDIVTAVAELLTRGRTQATDRQMRIMNTTRVKLNSGLVNAAIYDAAMHLVNMQDLVYRVQIDGTIPLSVVLNSNSVASVDSRVLDYIASRGRVEDVDSRMFESLARSLSISFDGTESGLAARNRRLFSIAKLAAERQSAYDLVYSKSFPYGADENRLVPAGNQVVTAVKTATGYSVKVDADGPKEFLSREDLEKFLTGRGFRRAAPRIVFTMAKVIESTNMFQMIRELGLGHRYLELIEKSGEQPSYHPMLRRNDEGGFLYSESEAEKVLAEELARAEEGRAAESGSAEHAVYNRVWGPNGYMTIGERLLDSLGVSRESVHVYAGDGNAYQPPVYTLNLSVGRLSASSNDVYVPVDASTQADLESSLVNARLLTAFSSGANLLRSRLGTVVSDFVSQVDAIAEAAIRETEGKDPELFKQLTAFRRTCTSQVDRLVKDREGKLRVERGAGLSYMGFTTLAGQFAAFRAGKDITHPFARACATIAPEVYKAPSFPDFANLVDLTLGGSGFLTEALRSGRDAELGELRGLQRLVALASAGDTASFTKSMAQALPEGMSYTRFLDLCVRSMQSLVKRGAPELNREKVDELKTMAAAADAAPAVAQAEPATVVKVVNARYSMFGAVRFLIDHLRHANDTSLTTAQFDFLQELAKQASADSNVTDAERKSLSKILGILRRERSAENEGPDRLHAARLEVKDLQTKLDEALANLTAANAKLDELRAAQGAGSSDVSAALETAVQEQRTAAGKLARVVSDAEGEGISVTPEAKAFVEERTDRSPGTVGLNNDAVDGWETNFDDEDADNSIIDGQEALPTMPTLGEDRSVIRMGEFDESDRVLTESQAALMVNLAVRSLVAQSSDVGEDAVVRTVRVFIPSLTKGEEASIRRKYRKMDEARMGALLSWDAADTAGGLWGSEDDKADDDISSDKFNNNALDEYNVPFVADFTAIATRVMPEIHGSLQGFMRIVRDLAEQLPDNLAAQRLMKLLNSRMSDEPLDPAQLSADFAANLDGIVSDARDVIDGLLAGLHAPQCRAGAFLVAYLASLPSSARLRFALLGLNSVTTSPVHVNSGNGLIEPAFRATAGRVTENLVVDCFANLVGFPREEIKSMAKRLRDSAAAAPKAEGLAARADVVAGLLMDVLGPGTPLVNALTMGIARTRWTKLSPTMSAPLAAALDLSNEFGVVSNIAYALDEFAKGEGPLTREEMSKFLIPLFTTGRTDVSSLSARQRSAFTTDPMMTFLSLYVDAVPETIMTAEIDPERDSSGTSIVVAPRDVPPLLLRWLYAEGETRMTIGDVTHPSFADVCRSAFNADDRTISRCRQLAQWPDGTPVCAKSISASLDALELHTACALTYDHRGEDGTWYVPMYSGDHSSGTLVRIPKTATSAFDAKTFDEAAELVYAAIGMPQMYKDAKRSAISSLEATGVGFVARKPDGSFGECRVHIMYNYGYDLPGVRFDKRDKNAALLGSTVVRGYGAKMLKRIAKDPKSATLKAHFVSSTGKHLFFIKSLSVSTSEDTGKFLGCHALSAYEGYADSYRGKADPYSTDIVTDYDSYKIGVAGSAAFRVLNDSGKAVKLMDVVFARLRRFAGAASEDKEALAQALASKCSKLSGPELDAAVGDLTVVDYVRADGVPAEGVKLSEILHGVEVRFVDRFDNPVIDLSYQENGTMGYPVANVSHTSEVPREPGRTPRNYELDALAMESTLDIARGDRVAESLVAEWGLVNQVIAAHPAYRKAAAARSYAYNELIAGGEHPDGVLARHELAQALWADIRESSNIPLVGIDAPLISGAASIDDDGRLFAHSKSKMLKDMMRGSEAFTAEEANFFGRNRRPALCCVNCAEPWFRHGWFLDTDAFNSESEFDGYRHAPGPMLPKGRAVALTLRDVLTRLRRLEHELRAGLVGKDKTDEKERDEEVKAAQDRVYALRNALGRVFVDHHNQKVGEVGDMFAYNFDDLFDEDGNFDLTAVQCDDVDLVHNDGTGRRHIYLAGTMFGLPRTPSYNGAPFLQVVRAGLPVTEIEEKDEESGATVYRPGRDAMVMPDPYTLDIEGCDHDGDKSKLYMIAPNSKGVVEYGKPPVPPVLWSLSSVDIIQNVPVDDPRSPADAPAKIGCRDLMLRELLASGWLAQRWFDEETQTVKPVSAGDEKPNTFAVMSPGKSRAVSNLFVRHMFKMASMLPCVEEDGTPRVSKPGQPRLKFAGSLYAPRTKAFPVANKGDVTEGAIAPGLFENSTLGKPVTAALVSRSSEDADKARGTMVALARALHMAWASGAITGLNQVTGADWIRFIHRIDGLSNATFDDIKEQICGRLGWTHGLMQLIVGQLVLPAVNGGKLPTTDAEFAKILRSVAREVNTSGSVLNFVRGLMDPSDQERLTRVKEVLAGGNASVNARLFMARAGIERDEEGLLVLGAASAAGDAELHRAVRLLVSEGADLGNIVGAIGRAKGRNTVAGLVTAFAVAPGTAEVKAELAQHVASLINGVTTMGNLSGFERTVNYLTADPNRPSARVPDPVADYERHIEATPEVDPRKVPASCDLMNATTALAYDLGDGVSTILAKAARAAAEDRGDPVATAVKAIRNGNGSESRASALVRLAYREPLNAGDRMTLEANVRQLPQMYGFFASTTELAPAGSPYDTPMKLYSAIANMANAVAAKGVARFVNPNGKPGPMTYDSLNVTFGARRAIESLFSLMIRLMNTSTELGDNPVSTHFRMTRDKAYGKQLDIDLTGQERTVFPYGTIGDRLSRIMPYFRTSGIEAFRETADLVDRIITGRSFAGKRVRPVGRTVCTSFTLSKETLGTFVSELAGGRKVDVGSFESFSEAVRELAVAKAITDKDLIYELVDAYVALDALSDGKVTPAVMFGQLLPFHTLLTTRTMGAPSVSSPSIISTLPRRYYQAISSAEARLAKNDPAMWNLLVRQDHRPFLESKEKAFRKKYPKASKMYSYDAFSRATSAALDDKGAAYVSKVLAEGKEKQREFRGNPDYRNTVDIFTGAPFYFIAKHLTDGAPAPTGSDAPTNGVTPKKEIYDPVVANMATCMGGLLSWATVTYTGGATFTIKGNLKGNIGGGRSVCITVDTTPLATCDSPEHVTALAKSASFLASIAETADLGLSAEEIALLPLTVREELVRQFQIGGATSNKVAFRLHAGGMATLLGNIALPRAKGSTIIYHEYFHQMMRMFEAMGMFSEEDYKALERQFGKPPAGKSWRFNEENAAEAFRNWVADRTTSGASTVRGVFARILETLQAIYSAILKGFGYSGEETDDTLFNFMVHGIAHTSDSRLAEVEESVEDEKARQVFHDAVERRDQVAIASFLRANRASRLSGTDLGKTKTKLKKYREESAAALQAKLAELAADALPDMEESPGFEAVPQELTAKSYSLELRAIRSFSDGSSRHVIKAALRELADVRANIAGGISYTPDIESSDVAYATVTRKDLAPEGTPAGTLDSIRENVAAVVSPIVDVNPFYHAAKVINGSLRESLERNGSWSGPLRDIINRYRMPNRPGTDEERDRIAVLEGLRKAYLTIDPEKAKAITDTELGKSMAFQAALRMFYHGLVPGFARNNAGTGNGPNGPSTRPSPYMVSAWLLSVEPTSAAKLVSDAREATLHAYRKTSSSFSRTELAYHLEQLDALAKLTEDPTGLSRDDGVSARHVLNGVIMALRAGVHSPGLDARGRLMDFAPIENPDAAKNPLSPGHAVQFDMCKGDRAVQASLKRAIETAYQVASMINFHRELDLMPLDDKAARDFATATVPPHVTATEWMAAHGIAPADLVDGPPLIEMHDSAQFIAHNVDAWLGSLVRKSFGARGNIGEMLSAENREYAAIKSRIGQLDNFMSCLFGTNVEAGGRLLRLKKHTGKYRAREGAIERYENGEEYGKFDNYRKDTCNVKFTEEDLRAVDVFLKACAARAGGQRAVVTGVDQLFFHAGMSVDPADYAPGKILELWNGGKPARALDALEMACLRMIRQIPECVLGADPAGAPRPGAFYDRFVNAAVRAMENARSVVAGYVEAGAENHTEIFNSFVLSELAQAGVCVAHNPTGGTHPSGGIPTYTKGAVAVPVIDIDRMFRSSDAYGKLTSEEGGRTAEMLDMDSVVGKFMRVWQDAMVFVRKHPWLVHGDGKYFNAFGTHLPFWRGSGVFMYNAVRTNRESAPAIDGKEGMLVQLAAQELPLAMDDTNKLLFDSALAAASRMFRLNTSPTDLLARIQAGRYAEGARDAERTGFVLAPGSTTADLARVMYRKMLEDVWEGYKGAPVAGSQQLQSEIASYEMRMGTKGEIFGGACGFNDEQMYRREGQLPANMQIGHKVHVAVDGITNAMMARATLANLLMTPAADGAPVYFADPAEYAEHTSGLPDAFWAQVARWWCEYAGLDYDMSKTGIANAKAVYAKLLAERELTRGKIFGKSYSELSRDEGDVMTVDRWLVRDGGDDDESLLNALGGGEAMGYLKHYVQAGRVLGFGGPAMRATVHRALAWSKSMSVSFSFFFPIATKWESPIGAIGAMATLASNRKFVGDIARKHPKLFNALQGHLSGKGWVTKDFLGFSDILEMMDSEDPFLAELISWADALGVTVSSSSMNLMEPTRSYVENDIRRLREMVRDSMGGKAAAKFMRIMETVVLRQGDKAFNYALNATKLAVVAQLAMKLRYEAQRMGKAFDPIRDLRKYAGYINAEVGGIDPMRYAWAHPLNQSIMNTLMFSWQWTRGAWEAGGGTALEDLVFGGHSTTKEERDFYFGRWIRMYGAVMIGVPALMQALVMGFAKLLGGGDDEDDTWATWNNESKARWTAFDITPLLKVIAEADDTLLGGALRKFKQDGGKATGLFGAVAGAAMGARGGNWLTGLIGAGAGAVAGSYVPSLIPMYTGNDAANKTSRSRRYYMHFGKQGWEFFRWFDDAKGQFFSKLSMPLQRSLEGIMGRNLSYLDRALPWDDMGQFERWLSLSGNSALVNMAQAWLPFSVGSFSRMGDAGALSAAGPVQMGASQTAIQDALVARLAAWANNDREGFRYGFKKSDREGYKSAIGLTGLVADILEDARRNGFDPEEQLSKAIGQVLNRCYGALIDLIPDTPDGDIDKRAMEKAARATNRLGAKREQVLKSLKDRLERQHRPVEEASEEMKNVYRGVLGLLREPFGTIDY